MNAYIIHLDSTAFPLVMCVMFGREHQCKKLKRTSYMTSYMYRIKVGYALLHVHDYHVTRVFCVYSAFDQHVKLTVFCIQE